MLRQTSHIRAAAALALLFAALASAVSVRAQLADLTLFDFSGDAQGWILQSAQRHYDQSGQDAVLGYLPFSPEGWDDGTHYPFAPGSDPIGDSAGSFQLGLRLEGVWDGVNPEHRWRDAAFLQSEDVYTHAQSGWPAGYEAHPDYTGLWTYGHYATIGVVTGDYLRLRVYQPGFTHANDPVQAWLYTRSGPGSLLTESVAYDLEHGWNVLRLPVSAIADPGDLREVGAKLASPHPIWGNGYVDEVQLGATAFDGRRYVYLTPDIAWLSEQTGYDTRRVKVFYDDGGATTPGVRGFNIVIRFPADAVRVTAVTAGSLLTSYPNHFEYAIDNVAGRITFDWVILGSTSGACGFGSLAEITFDAADGHAGDDACGALDLADAECRLRDPENNPLPALFVDGRVSHDITPPDDPLLASPTHAEGVLSGQNDVQVTWATNADGGACPVGVRGYYLLLDQSETGVPDPATSQYSWFTPWAPDSTGYAHGFGDVGDGDWFVHIIGYDYLWNATQVDTYGPIRIDTAAPENVTALDADITDNADLSADLVWANAPLDFAGVRIFRKGFGHYPEYDDDGGSVPPWPASPADALANGWVQVYDGAGSSFVDHPTARDYYYYAAFAYDAVQNFAAATAGSRDASLDYWLGDFTLGGAHVVDIFDVLVLSLAYYESAGDPHYNPVCDIGPTTNYGRKSRPTTDNEIEFEDLIVFAMNYENALLTAPPVAEPCRGTMTAGLVLEAGGGEIIASVELRGNPGCLLGASVELAYGPGLELIEATPGAIWSGAPAFFRATPQDDRRIALDGAALGGTIGAHGRHAVVRFRLAGGASDPGADLAALGVAIGRFRARGPGNIDLAGGSRAPAGADPVAPSVGTSWMSVHPNPVTSSATIRYALGNARKISLCLFDASGRALRVLAEGSRPSGMHQVAWDGRLADGRRAAPGIYFCRLDADGVFVTQKLMVVR